MTINRISTDISTQIASSAGTQNFSGTSSPAKVAGEIEDLRLLAYWDPDNPNKLEKTPKEYAKKLKEQNFQLIPGFFNFYSDKKTTLMEINPNQIGEENVFLLSAYRISGYLEKSTKLNPDAMMANYRVYFKQAGENIIQLCLKNVDSRSKDENTAEAIARSKEDIVLSSAEISMTCQGKILFDAKDLLVMNIEELLRPKHQNPVELNDINIDKQNSCLIHPKNTSRDSQIEASIVYAPKEEPHILTDDQEKHKKEQDIYNKTVTYNYSFSKLREENKYRPRLANEKIGCFSVSFDDYDKDKNDRKVEYIERWDLGKIDDKTGKPERPIKFKIAKTVNTEYADAVKKGILAWNEAFAAVGINGAIEIEETGKNDDSSDIRCNTVNFAVGGMGYSQGPSQADPLTGEIYAADIMLDKDMIEKEKNKIRYFDKNYAKLKDEKAKKEYLEKCLQNRVISLTFHEIGHGLGLRHNFKGSLKITNGIPASIMDYNPSLDGTYQTTPGEYDIEAIRYAYKPIMANTPEEEKAELENIIANMYAKNIPYGTDGDKELDPSCATFDSGNPLDYSKELVKRTQDLLSRMEKDFSFKEYLPIINFSLNRYDEALNLSSAYIGGLYVHRENIGNPAKLKYEPVPGKEQKESLKFILNELLPAYEININPDVEKNLGASVKDITKDKQTAVFNNIFSYEKLNSIIRNQKWYENENLHKNDSFKKSDQFKLSDLFETTKTCIFAELENKKSVSISKSRQNIQEACIDELLSLPTAKFMDANGNLLAFPKEARDLATQTLSVIQKDIEYILEKEKHNDEKHIEIKIDPETSAHLKKILAKISK